MTDFLTEEMREAWENATASVAEEKAAPLHIREARKRALLRWLDKGTGTHDGPIHSEHRPG